MRLHGDMRVQVIERAICLLTTLPTTLVHSFDFFISTAGALVLLGTGNGNEGIDLVEPYQIHDKRWRKQDKERGRGGLPRCQSLLTKHTCPGRPPAVTFGDAFGTLVAGD
jgi:hypothetical protein